MKDKLKTLALITVAAVIVKRVYGKKPEVNLLINGQRFAEFIE